MPTTDPTGPARTPSGQRTGAPTTVDAAGPSRGPSPEPLSELRSRLLACRDAEDYFALLDVPFDPHVLQVNRLHVLRIFGDALHLFLQSSREEEPAAAERLRAGLAAAHDAFTDATALDHRLFKVLQDRAPRGFVPLAEVAVEDGPADGATGAARDHARPGAALRDGVAGGTEVAR